MKILVSIIFLACCFNSYSQNCSDYYYMQNNKKIEMTIYNRKGKEAGKNIYSISNVSKSGNTMTSSVRSEFFDTKGKSVMQAANQVKCVGGVMMMDMKMFIPSGQQQQMGMTGSGSAADVYLEYPVKMKEGDALKDGSFSMNFTTSSGMAGTVSVNISNRKVLGKESVTTSAGTWNCYKISSKQKIHIKMGFGLPMHLDVIEWFAPGFGVVKTDSNAGKTEITSIK